MMNRLDTDNERCRVSLIVFTVVWAMLVGISCWFWGQESEPVSLPSETTVIKQRMTRIEEEFFDIEKRFGKIERRWIVIENEVFPYDERFGRNEKEE